MDFYSVPGARSRLRRRWQLAEGCRSSRRGYRRARRRLVLHQPANPQRDHQRVHECAEDLRDGQAAAAKTGWLVAAAALMLASRASAEPLRPVVTHEGWQLELGGYVQADVIPWTQDSIDELDPTGA